MSLFITFEGGEGCGKSTQARALYQKLHQQGIPVVLTHEPGGTALGNRIKREVKRKRADPVSPEAELFLFVASRTQLTAQVIQPALQQGKIVICDRFSYSTLAYQGYGRKLKMPAVETINNIATKGLKPALIILLDMPPEKGLTRKKGVRDPFELEDISFHRRVREGYLKMAAAEPDRWLMIDATMPKKNITGIIWDKVSQLLAKSESKTCP